MFWFSINVFDFTQVSTYFFVLIFIINRNTNMKRFSFSIFAFALLFSQYALAQSYAEYEIGGYALEQDPLAKHSIRPVTEIDRMWAEGQWVRVDMRQKQNEPMKAAGNEFVRLLIDATNIGAIKPFKNDSLTTRMNREEFAENMQVPGLGDVEPDPFDIDTEDPWVVDDMDTDGITPDEALDEAFAATWRNDQLYLVDIKVNKIYDRKHSRMVNDIESITIVVPAEFNPRGIEEVVATYSYKELKKNLFDNNPDAIWYNPDNLTEHRNLAEAFDLWLMSTAIEKVSNPRDDYMQMTYGLTDEKMEASQQHEFDIAEFESNTWSN